MRARKLDGGNPTAFTLAKWPVSLRGKPAGLPFVMYHSRMSLSIEPLSTILAQDRNAEHLV